MSQLWIESIMPTCAVCNKTVERMDAAQNHKHFGLEFIVYCHGDREAMTLPRNIDPCEVKPGVAFSKRRVRHHQPEGKK